MKKRRIDRGYRSRKPCVGKLSICSHEAHIGRPDEEAQEFQTESINSLQMNAMSLSNRMQELRELSNPNYAHLIGISETWISPQLIDQDLAMLVMSLFHNDRTRMEAGWRYTCDLAYRYIKCTTKSLSNLMSPYGAHYDHLLPRGI